MLLASLDERWWSNSGMIVFWGSLLEGLSEVSTDVVASSLSVDHDCEALEIVEICASLLLLELESVG